MLYVFIITGIIALFLVSVDKLLTFLTLQTIKIRFPEKDFKTLEKNYLARFFFVKFGLVKGSIIYLVISWFSFMISIFLFWFCFSYLTSLLIVCGIYFIVIVNNLFWFIKYYTLMER